MNLLIVIQILLVIAFCVSLVTMNAILLLVTVLLGITVACVYMYKQSQVSKQSNSERGDFMNRMHEPEPEPEPQPQPEQTKTSLIQKKNDVHKPNRAQRTHPAHRARRGQRHTRTGSHLYPEPMSERVQDELRKMNVLRTTVNEVEERDALIRHMMKSGSGFKTPAHMKNIRVKD